MSEIDPMVAALRDHLPRDGHNDDTDTAFTYCTCGGWTGDFFADGVGGPFDHHLADALRTAGYVHRDEIPWKFPPPSTAVAHGINPPPDGGSWHTPASEITEDAR